MRSQRIKLSFAPSIFLWSRREIDSFLGHTMYFECTAYVLLTDNNLYDAKAQPANSNAYQRHICSNVSLNRTQTANRLWFWETTIPIWFTSCSAISNAFLINISTTYKLFLIYLRYHQGTGIIFIILLCFTDVLSLVLA